MYNAQFRGIQQSGAVFFFIHRGKIQDLSHEISDMTKEIEAYTQENAAFLAFEKRYMSKIHNQTKPKVCDH